MHGINRRSRNPIELSRTENSALCLADRTAQSIRRRSENTYAIDLRDATLGPPLEQAVGDVAAPGTPTGTAGHLPNAGGHLVSQGRERVRERAR